jgi:transcriptional regulator with XRE-family HTH domain
MPFLKQYLANLLIARRQTLQLNQQELSDLSGVNKRTIVHLENASGNPSLETLQKLLDILGLDIIITLKSAQTGIAQ